MDFDDAISEINHNTQPNFERRVNLSSEIGSVKAHVRYMYYAIVLCVIITLMSIGFVVDLIQRSCSRNDYRYQEMLRIVSDIKAYHETYQPAENITRDIESEVK